MHGAHRPQRPSTAESTRSASGVQLELGLAMTDLEVDGADAFAPAEVRDTDEQELVPSVRSDEVRLLVGE